MIISVIGRAEKRETESVHDFGGVLADFFRGFSGLATFLWAFFVFFYHSVLCVFLASAKTAAILVIWFAVWWSLGRKKEVRISGLVPFPDLGRGKSDGQERDEFKSNGGNQSVVFQDEE